MALEYLETIGRAKDQLKKVATSPVAAVAKKFSEDAIQLMKSNLEGSGRVANGALKQSVGVEFRDLDGEGLEIDFLALDYWDYINAGVDGVQQNAGAVENQFGSTYSFKSLVPSRKMIEGFTGTGSLFGWMAAKGITTLTYTNTDGDQITKPLQSPEDFKQAAFVFAKAVKKKGIRPSQFVDKVLNEEAIERFQDDIFEALQKML